MTTERRRHSRGSFLMLLVLALAASSGAAYAHSPSACPAVPDVDAALTFVGETSVLIGGQQGRLGWETACQAEFPGSQVCSSRDIIVGGVPELTPAFRWVVPHWLDANHEYSGLLQNHNCNVLVVGASGEPEQPRFGSSSCNVPFAALCCSEP